MRDVKNSRAFLALRLVERSRKPSRILRNPKFKDLFKRGIYTLARIAPIDRVPFHLRPCLSTTRFLAERRSIPCPILCRPGTVCNVRN